MSDKKYTVKEVYEKVWDEIHYWEKKVKTTNGREDEVARNLVGAYTVVAMWLENTEELNPTK